MDNTNLVGRTLGRYPLESLIGSGGMGQVYLSKHPVLKRRCAIKVLRPELSASPEFVERFNAELRLMASMSHPNLVAIHDGDRTDGLCYLVMDYIAGADGKAESLQDRLAREPNRRLDAATALRFAIEMVRAIEYAHRMGIVHRDLKPANLLIDAQGTLRVTDFGVAKVVGNSVLLEQIHATMSSQATLAPERNLSTDQTLAAPRPQNDATLAPSDMTPVQRSSSASGLVGTLAWMSPEQKEASPSIDHRSDLYTVGLIFYRMLTGKMAGPRAKPASQTAGVPSAWDDVIDRCLAETPDERYASASDLLKDLERIGVAPEARSPVVAPVAPTPAPPVAAPAPVATRSGPRLALIGVGVVVAAAVVLLVLKPWGKAPPATVGGGTAAVTQPTQPETKPIIADPPKLTPLQQLDSLAKAGLVQPSQAKVLAGILVAGAQTDCDRRREAALMDVVAGRLPASGLAGRLAGVDRDETANDLSEAAKASSRPDEALRLVQRVLARDPGNQEAARLQRELHRSNTPAMRRLRAIEALAKAGTVDSRVVDLAGRLLPADPLTLSPGDLQRRALIEDAAGGGTVEPKVLNRRLDRLDAADLVAAARDRMKPETARQAADLLAKANLLDPENSDIASLTGQARDMVRRQTLSEMGLSAAVLRRGLTLLDAGPASLSDGDRLRRDAFIKAADAQLSRPGLIGELSRIEQAEVAAIVSRARLLLAAGERDGARAALQEALQRDPQHAVASELLRSLTVVVVAPTTATTTPVAVVEPVRKPFTTSQGVSMLWVPAGTVRMGSPDDEPGRDAVAEKQFTAKVTRGFYLAGTETRVSDFAAFCQASLYRSEGARAGWAMGTNDKGEPVKVNGITWERPGFLPDRNEPVVCVTWNDAQKFCQWLSRRDNRTYRLPTEAEWELACRAGAVGAYPWGKETKLAKAQANLADMAWAKKYPGFTDAFAFDDGCLIQSIVGRFPANPLGLHDMVGNVEEWCQDWYAPYPAGEVVDPKGADAGEQRVCRGGSFASGAAKGRIASRGRATPDTASVTIGFRIAADAP